LRKILQASCSVKKFFQENEAAIIMPVFPENLKQESLLNAPLFPEEIVEERHPSFWR